MLESGDSGRVRGISIGISAASWNMSSAWVDTGEHSVGDLACETEFSTLLVEIFMGRDVDVFNRNELRTKSSMRLIGSSSFSKQKQGKETRKNVSVLRRREPCSLLSRYPISKVDFFLAGQLCISGNLASPSSGVCSFV